MYSNLREKFTSPILNTCSPIQIKILKLLNTHRSLSKREISRFLNLPASTVAPDISALIANGSLVQNGTGISTGGRRPQLFSCTTDLGYIALSEIGTTHAQIGIADAFGNIVQTKGFPLETNQGPRYCCQQICELAASLASSVLPDAPLIGTALALPCPIDPGTNQTVYPTRLPNWNGVDISRLYQKISGKPVSLFNDADMVAYGAHINKGVSSSIGVKVGSAIGAGIICDNKLIKGSTGAVGDISHTRVANRESNRICECGRTGCLATITAGAFLVEIYNEAAEKPAKNTEDFFERSRSTDSLARHILYSAGLQLGNALCPIVAMFNPEAVLFSGRFSASPEFISAVRVAIYDGCHPLATRDIKIEKSVLGPDAALHGLTGQIFSEPVG